MSDSFLVSSLSPCSDSIDSSVRINSTDTQNSVFLNPIESDSLRMESLESFSVSLPDCSILSVHSIPMDSQTMYGLDLSVGVDGEREENEVSERKEMEIHIQMERRQTEIDGMTLDRTLEMNESGMRIQGGERLNEVEEKSVVLEQHVEGEEKNMEAFKLASSLLMDCICPICSLVFGRASPRNPLTLSCGHTFCRFCLSNWFENHEHKCPIDKNSILLPQNGVDALGWNLILLNLVDKIQASGLIVGEIEEDPKIVIQLNWGTLGNGDYNLNRPYGVNIDPISRNVFVADYGNHRVMIFDEYGTFIRKFGSYGVGNLNFNSPYGVAISRDGNILYVSDTFNHRICLYTPEGSFIKKISLEANSTPHEIENCLPVCVWPAKNGDLFISDNGNHRVLIYSEEGNFLFKFGAFGISNSQFNRPYAIGGIETDPAVVGEGEEEVEYCSIMVADYANHRIAVFERNGRFKFNIGAYGAGNGQLNSPFGFACGNGKVYVTDTYNHRISVFSAINGRFLRVIYADQFGQQGLPVAASFDVVSNTLFVSDNGLHCIRALKID